MESPEKAKMTPEEKAQNILDLPRDQAEKVLSILLKEHNAEIEGLQCKLVDVECKLVEAEDRWREFQMILNEETDLVTDAAVAMKDRLEQYMIDTFVEESPDPVM
jgi:hypothetical protein